METNRAKTLFNGPADRYQMLYTMLLETIPSSVLIFNRDMRVAFANRNFMEKSRRVMKNTIDCRLEDVFPPVIIKETPIAGQIREVFHSNQPTKGQRMSFRSPGVSMRIYYYRIVPLAWEGNVESVMLLMDDVTEQIRLSEEVRSVQRHLESIFESTSDIIFSTDINARILSWNPAAERISGYTFKEVEGRFFSKLCAENYRKRVKKIFSDMQSREDSISAEWNLITKTGTDIQVAWVCSPMKDQQLRTSGIVVVGRDNTERRKMEMQLFQSQKFAALGVMAGGIAHEIRNPLASSSSAAQFLLEDDISPDFRAECAQKICAGIQRASLIIENLLQFARPPLKSAKEEIDLLKIIEETIALIANQAGIQKVKIKTRFPAHPVFINGSGGLLQQVFINLFLNSFKAMPDSGTLNISVDNTNDSVLIRVADTGAGISREIRDKIFDPFYTSLPVGQGTGLGLSICYSIIEQHSGTIEVDSRESRGTTFTITLPRP